MAIFAPAASGMRAWSRTEYGRPRVVVSRVIEQLTGLGCLAHCGLALSLVAFPSYAEIARASERVARTMVALVSDWL